MLNHGLFQNCHEINFSSKWQGYTIHMKQNRNIMCSIQVKQQH